MNEISNDERAVFDMCRTREGVEEITDGCARTIGSWYAVGMGVSQTFATTGEIADYEDLWNEITDDRSALLQIPRGSDHYLALNMLGTYLVNRVVAGQIGPVAGWSGLWVR